MSKKTHQEQIESLAKIEANTHRSTIHMADVPVPEEDQYPTLSKSILNILNGPKDSIERLAFESDPKSFSQYVGIYRPKEKLIPDDILKRIAIQDDLVACIVQARSNHLSAFGRPRPDRFSTGFIVEPNVGVMDDASEEQKEEIKKRIDNVIKRFQNCGNDAGWSVDDRMSLSTWLNESTRNAIVVGRIATEVIYVQDRDGKKQFHSFRPIDAGTIYKASPQQEAEAAVRKSAFHQLERLKNKKLIPEKFQKDEYAWIQVIKGTPVQAFTSEECLVQNFYPANDVELNGYPITPLDTVMAAVTTHINITTMNKLYFQNGRASRGMLIIKSNDVNERVTARIRQQFNASINNVNNSYRMPVFGIGPNDELTWAPIDSGSKDMEYQYLSDMNCRSILSAFMMSPEEVPGYAYLSRGTNSQALSESNSEYKLEAARDIGIRPLIHRFEDFLNERIFPLIDAELAKICRIKLVGLDADTAEKESVRIAQDAPIHMTYDEILDRVDKKSIGKEWGGEFPINPQWQAVVDKYLKVGVILERFFGIEGASTNPEYDYIRDQFYWQQKEYIMEMQQLQAQQQAAAQQQAQGGGQPQPGGQEQQQAEGGGEGGGQEEQPPMQHFQTEKQKTESSAESSASGTDLTRSIDQAIDLLSKSEDQLPPSKRRLLAQQKLMVKKFLDGFKVDLNETTKEIMDVAEKHLPSKAK